MCLAIILFSQNHLWAQTFLNVLGFLEMRRFASLNTWDYLTHWDEGRWYGYQTEDVNFFKCRIMTSRTVRTQKWVPETAVPYTHFEAFLSWAVSLSYVKMNSFMHIVLIELFYFSSSKSKQVGLSNKQTVTQVNFNINLYQTNRLTRHRGINELLNQSPCVTRTESSLYTLSLRRIYPIFKFWHLQILSFHV